MGTRNDKVSRSSSEEDFALRRRRLEDFLADEQERLQNFLFEESSVLPPPRESGRVGGTEEEGGEEGEGGGGVGGGGEGEGGEEGGGEVVEEGGVGGGGLQHDAVTESKIKKVLEEVEKGFGEEEEKIAQWEGRRKSAVDNDTDRVELLRVAAGMLTTRKPDISSRENEQKIGSEKKNEVNRPIEEKKNEKGESGHNGYNPLGSEVVGGGEDTIGGSQAKPYFDLSVKVDRVKDEEAGMEEKERDLEQTQIEGSEHEHEHENEYEDEDEQRHQQEHEHEEGQDERDEEHEHQERHQQGQEEEEREGGERLRRVSEECQRDQKFLIKVAPVGIIITPIE